MKNTHPNLVLDPSIRIPLSRWLLLSWVENKATCHACKTQVRIFFLLMSNLIYLFFKEVFYFCDLALKPIYFPFDGSILLC